MDPFPTREAEKLLKGWGVNSLPIKPIDIATQNGITCQQMESSEGGVSGMLVKVGDFFGIQYATHIPVPGFQHFSVAHELGHYFLPNHAENVLTNGIHNSKAGFVSVDEFEVQADQFACGLLMPTYLFDPELDKAGEGLDAVIELADACGTSRTATAIRYAQRHSEPAAIVVSRNGVIDYCFMSDELKEYPGLTWLKKGSAVPKGTITKQFNASQVVNGDREDGESDLTTWFKSNRGGEIYEEVLGLGSYGKTLTVLSCSDVPDRQEMEEERELEESWTPRFRK